MPPIDRPRSTAMQRLEQANAATTYALLQCPKSARPDEARETLEQACRELSDAIDDFLFERRGGIRPWRLKGEVGASGAVKPVAKGSDGPSREGNER